jgi:hypothetical protein
MQTTAREQNPGTLPSNPKVVIVSPSALPQLWIFQLARLDVHHRVMEGSHSAPGGAVSMCLTWPRNGIIKGVVKGHGPTRHFSVMKNLSMYIETQLPKREQSAPSSNFPSSRHCGMCGSQGERTYLVGCNFLFDQPPCQRVLHCMHN